MQTSENILRKQLIEILDNSNAHANLESALEGLPANLRGQSVHNLPYTIWSILKHIEIAQDDIVDFSTNSDYKSKSWPDDYWPESTAPRDAMEWDDTFQKIKSDRKRMIELIQKGEYLYVPFKHGNGQNLLREILLIADHNAYHIGQLVVLRRLLGDWD